MTTAFADPFSNAALDSNDLTEEAPKAVGTAYVDVKPRVSGELTNLADGKIVLTFKEGTSFDSSWIVIHAGSVAEADAILDQPLADLMVKAKRVATHFRGGAAASSSPAGGGNSGGRSNAPQGASEAPSWAPPKPYDDFVYKSGISAKNGKMWHAWMPPQKGDSRDAKFFYPN